MKKLVIVALLASGLALSACNTVRGVGDDLKSVADKVDKET
jgi:predicted small secreted protein